MKITNLKLRNTDHGHSPFEGVILTSCKATKQGKTIDLSEDLIYEHIQGVILEGDWEDRPSELAQIIKFIKGKGLKIAIREEE